MPLVLCREPEVVKALKAERCVLQPSGEGFQVRSFLSTTPSWLFVALAEVVSWTVQTVPCLVDVARRVQVVKRIRKKEEKEEEGLPGPRQDEESAETTWGS